MANANKFGDSQFMNSLEGRVLVFDGAMGTAIQARDLSLADYEGHENCVDVITLTRPDVVRDIHRSYLGVGCDAVMTNTFGANKIVFSEFGIAERTYEANRKSAEIARACAREFDRPGQPRFVIGSCGPGTRLPSLGQTTWDALVDSYTEQVRGLLDGGVDAILIETCQDILQAKSAIVAATDAMREKGREVPILCTVTIETVGTMLVGTEMAAALAAIEAYPQVAAIGLNCATGPQEMSEHIRYLSGHSDRRLIVQPNAGLPQLVGGKPHYALTPAELSRWLIEFIEVDGVNIVGGCCGTTPAHLAAVVDAVGRRAPKPRSVKSEPAVASLYQAMPMRQEASVLAIGERTNANGSKKFRELLAAGDVDGMVQMAREQISHGSHLLDVCTAYVGRDEVADMTAVIKRFATDVTVPLAIDSTEVPVLEAALKLYGGKAVINSINLEDGEHRLDAVCTLARRHGAAVIALTIDEQGMAKTCARKVEVAKRIYELATGRHGIKPHDLIFDPLTFTICTGNEDDRRLGLETLDALAAIKEACPGVHTLLGLSNISFGVKPPARRVLNSVFLHHARERGLDSAIMHVSGIVPLYKIEEEHRRLAEDLIYDRRREGYDPLTELLKAFESVESVAAESKAAPKSVEERLKLRIINGDRTGLEEDLDEAMLTHRPLDIINDILLDGMKTVGDLFGAGQMQLPFVLQSAETMKASVRHLEPHMEKKSGGGKGSIVLATVRGDVHDIGKNLVDIILTNNGYTVYNLGIKQPINNIIEAFEKHAADAIGMSGLLVKSTVVMRENLAVLNERGIDPPVILGGAALTRKYVEQDLRPEYFGPLHYAKDAFAGLNLMDQIAGARESGAGGRGSGVGRRGTVGATGPGAPGPASVEFAEPSQPGPRAAVSQSVPRAEASGLTPLPVRERGRGEGGDAGSREGFDRIEVGGASGASAAGTAPIAPHALHPHPALPLAGGGGPVLREGGGAPVPDLHEEASERFGYVPPKSNISRDEPVPQPPFWGRRVIEHIDPRAALAYLNENMLFQVQWQYRKNRRKPEDFKRYINDEVRPILRRLLDQCERENILQLKAIYGFWPVQSDGDTLIVYDPVDRERQLAVFDFPRMGKPPYWCLSDFFKPVSSEHRLKTGATREHRLETGTTREHELETGATHPHRLETGATQEHRLKTGATHDVAAFMVVTAGRRVSEVAREWFAQDRYQDYLHLHGLGVESAEALAEYIHKQIRMEWGIAGSDARDKQEIFKQHYQGSRYSFGYPACPRLEDQLKLWPILHPEDIGVTLSEEFQLEPEQTTTALVTHHRQGKYFNVR